MTTIVLSVEESAETKELYEALQVFADHAEPLMKVAENPHFKSSYADLAEVMRVARPAMKVANLVLTQAMAFGEAGALYCTTKLVHTKSGQWMRSYYPLTPQRSDSQGIGSANTYGRRYAAMAILGLAPEDDDGEASHGRDTKPVRKTQTREIKPVRDAKPVGKVTAVPSSVEVEQMIAAFAKIEVDERELAEMIGGPLVGITTEQFAWLRNEYGKRRDVGSGRAEAARVLATTTRPMARNGRDQ